MRKVAICLMLLFLALLTVSAYADTLFIDNQEKDKTDLMRLNMRTQPSSGSSVIASYYTGAEVTVLESTPAAAATSEPETAPEVTEEAAGSDVEGTTEENPETPAENGKKADVAYVHVEIGGVQGYMSEKYLITADEARARYGENSWFGNCRDAEVDLTGMWKDNVTMVSSTGKNAVAVGTIATGEAVHMVGIVGNWAYVRKDAKEGNVFGYVPLDVVTETGSQKVYIISTNSPEQRMALYESPSVKSKSSMSLSNGTTCFMLFGRGEGEWRRIRVGSVSGWVLPSKKSTIVALGASPRSSIPYYPLVMETKSDALLYSAKGNKNEAYMTLGSQMRVEVLGESSDFLYVRTLIGGAGAYNKGDYGYIALSDLTLSISNSSMGVVQVDDQDMPVVVYHEPDTGSRILGALCGGSQVRLMDYTQTDFVRIGLNDLTGYVRKDSVRILTQETDALSDRIAQRGTAKQNIKLSDEPSRDSGEGAAVEAGTRMYMLGKFGDWMFVNADTTPNLNVTVQNEQTGFVHITDLSAPASTTHLTATVRTDKVNLRSDPDKTGDIIGRVRLGELLRVTDYGNQWTCVVTGEGKRGYIMTEYLDFD